MINELKMSFYGGGSYAYTSVYFNICSRFNHYSGIAAIGKFVGFFVLLFAVLWLFTQPVLLIIAIVVLVLIVIAFSAK